MANVLVVMEARGDGWHPVALEAVAAAQQLAAETGAECAAIVLGSDAAARAATLPVAQVYAVEHELLAAYTADAWTGALAQAIAQLAPTHVVFPHTYQVRDYAPALAVRCGSALVSDVIAVKPGPVFVRQLFGGKLNAEYSAAQTPAFVSVQAGAFRAPESGSTNATVTKLDVSLDAAQLRTKPSEPFREAARTVDLGSAAKIVSVGRGIGDEANLALVQELAAALGAELAASRPICDNGWLPMERQVGSSGQTVAPKLYFAVGISGAIQHLVGMKGAKTVVAINKDAEAPIFEVADIGIVGDLFELVPAITKALAK
jgi:electron transfer flavoprotein alpha subunit